VSAVPAVLRPPLHRAPSRNLGAAILRVPLAWKLAGANALVVLSASAAALAVHAPRGHDRGMVLVMEAALVLSFLANLALVLLSLRPLRALGATAERVCLGDVTARVPDSPLADRDLTRVGVALNAALDGVTAARDRARTLAAVTVDAAERERARIAHELHESTAQSLAALVYQLSAAALAAAESGLPALRARLEAATTSGREVMEDVRTLAQTVHPLVLNDLGLNAALEQLAQDARKRTSAAIEVAGAQGTDRIPSAAASVLYRVAHEALANATRHAAARQIRVRLEVRDGTAVLGVADDGRGFDAREAAVRLPGMGLFLMRERVVLLDGRLEVLTTRGGGTRVTATVALGADEAAHSALESLEEQRVA
jgi:signal transduction histidine kinase